MSFSIERTGDVSTVHMSGALVGSDRIELRREVLGELAIGVSLLRIDLGNAGYIDGAGLGLLVSLSKVVREHDAEFRLANVNAELRTLFALTKLDLIFTVERNDDAAPNAPAVLPPRSSELARGTAEERPSP